MNDINQSLLSRINDKPFLTDGGLETVLVFHHGLDLPCFAAFDLLREASGTETIRSYYDDYMEIARRNGTGFILEAPTWRASPDWAEKLGYSMEALDTINQEAINLLHELRDANPDIDCLVSGCVGPRGDGYVTGEVMTAIQACGYHRFQIDSFRKAKADVVSAITMTCAEEAIGICNAASGAGLPAVISFTLETDGRLPSGEPLKSAIQRVDGAADVEPVYYMINCAHPDHFEEVLVPGDHWLSRIGGLRANASRMSHEELDAAEELDDGNPAELGQQYRKLRERLPNLKVVGGCCGTDHRHIAAISDACHR